MIRLVAVIVYTLFCVLTNNAQISYYKLTRVVKDGASNTDVSGGQFISFVNDLCYDSDINGFSVENGILKFRNAENNIVTYVGESYWGKCIYKFDYAKMNLNVVSPDGYIYVYKKCASPNNITTSSLIKRSSNPQINLESNVSESLPSNHSQVVCGHYEYRTERCIDCQGRGYNEKTIWHGGDKTSTVQIRCSFCHGKGIVTKREYVIDN